MSNTLNEWSGEPREYDHFAEDRRPPKIGHTFFLRLPINQETMKFDIEQRKLWKLLRAARSETPRNFNRIRKMQNDINAHLIQYDEPILQFPPLKRTFRECLIAFIQKKFKK